MISVYNPSSLLYHFYVFDIYRFVFYIKLLHNVYLGYVYIYYILSGIFSIIYDCSIISILFHIYSLLCDVLTGMVNLFPSTVNQL